MVQGVGRGIFRLPMRSMFLLTPYIGGCGALTGYFVVREQVRQTCPMSDDELRECREWFEGSARKMGALEWDQIMGSGRLIFIAFARGDKFIYPTDMDSGRFSENAEHSPEVSFLSSQTGMEPAAIAKMVYAMAQVADRNHDGKISAKEFLMVWTVFCHFTLVENLGDLGVSVDGPGNDTLESVIFNLADTDDSGFVDFEELVIWVDILMALNLIPDEDRIEIIGSKGIMQVNTASDVAGKYIKRFDIDDDRILSRKEFIELSHGLRLKSAMWDAISIQKKNAQGFPAKSADGEEEPVDQRIAVVETCKIQPKNAKLWGEYTSCAQRIVKKGHGECTAQYFDFWKSMDKCVGPAVFKNLT